MENVYSDFKVLCHPDKLAALYKNERMAPLYVRIKPTNVCNQKCWYCVYADDIVIDNRKVNHRESIPWEKMKEIISELSEMGTKAITFSGGGEPLCYPYIRNTIELVKEKHMDYAMITNGQALDEDIGNLLSDAKWVRISLDSVNAQMYESIRGVNTFDKVINNIEKFARQKGKECVLGINYVVSKDNYKNVYDMCKIANTIGVNNIKFAPLMVKGEIPKYHVDIKDEVESQIREAKKNLEDDKFRIIDKYSKDDSFNVDFCKKYSKCHIIQMFTVIGADCKVYYCHQRAYTPAGMIGDLSKQTFKELWYSKETTEKLENMQPQKECNFRCVFEERNQLLDSLINMDRKHINFI